MSNSRGGCLYVATTNDLVRAIMQSTNYYAYLQEHVSSKGPKLDGLRLWRATQTKNPKALLIAVNKLLGGENFATCILYLQGNEVFGSSKCKLDMASCLANNSHRSDKVIFLHPKVQTQSTCAWSEVGSSSAPLTLKHVSSSLSSCKCLPWENAGSLTVTRLGLHMECVGRERLEDRECIQNIQFFLNSLFYVQFKIWGLLLVSNAD